MVDETFGTVHFGDVCQSLLEAAHVLEMPFDNLSTCSVNEDVVAPSVSSVEVIDGGYRIVYEGGSSTCRYCIVSVGRSGSKWMESICQKLDIPARSNRVDLGVTTVLKITFTTDV